VGLIFASTKLNRSGGKILLKMKTLKGMCKYPRLKEVAEKYTLSYINTEELDENLDIRYLFLFSDTKEGLKFWQLLRENRVGRAKLMQPHLFVK